MKTNVLLLVPCVLAASATSALAGGGASAGVPPEAQAAYARVLSGYVEKGRVNYARLARTGRSDLDAYLSAVASAELPTDRDARIGFLVDAYNALVLKAVIDSGRPRSVLDVEGFFNAAKHRVAGRELTLDQLEKAVLNPYAKDPRTHFVLVCGAVGCPILEPEPYLGSDIDARMERATRRYLATAFGSRTEGATLYVSKIFDWYASDFGGAGGVLAFVRPRLPEAARAKLPESPEVKFLEYNWTLNQQ